MPWVHDGRYWILQQEEGEQTCGLCCVATVVRNLKPDWVRTDSGLRSEARALGPGNYAGRAWEFPGAIGTPILPALVHGGALPPWAPQHLLTIAPRPMGTGGRPLAQLLMQHGVNSAQAHHGTSQDLKNAMRGVRPGHPLIALVHRQTSRHWVVVVERNTHWGGPSDYTVLDPESGRVVHNRGSTSYQVGAGPAAGTFGDNHGAFFVTV